MINCPQCGSELKRIRRLFSGRIVSIIFPMRRFRCGNSKCGYEGGIADRDGIKKRLLQLLLPVLFIVLLLLLRFML